MAASSNKAISCAIIRTQFDESAIKTRLGRLNFDRQSFHISSTRRHMNRDDDEDIFAPSNHDKEYVEEEGMAEISGAPSKSTLVSSIPVGQVGKEWVIVERPIAAVTLSRAAIFETLSDSRHRSAIDSFDRLSVILAPPPCPEGVDPLDAMPTHFAVQSVVHISLFGDPDSHDASIVAHYATSSGVVWGANASPSTEVILSDSCEPVPLSDLEPALRLVGEAALIEAAFIAAWENSDLILFLRRLSGDLSAFVKESPRDCPAELIERANQTLADIPDILMRGLGSALSGSGPMQ